MKQILFFIPLLLFLNTKAQKTVTFPSKDGLTITADFYKTSDKKAPFIILFHQAGWSRGAYKEIAPKLNALGFNCLAIDQRSGGEINGIINQTHQQAKEKNLPVAYTDAMQDMHAAVDYVKSTFPMASKIIIWGSSYSAALVLKIAGEREDIDAVLSFSPGEYFEKEGKPKDFITSSAKNIAIPVFITSAKNEKSYWWNIYEAIPAKRKQYFLPKNEGQHGSRALWEKFDEHEAYWNAVKSFLRSI
ncbi:MAG: hypothetical protein Kow0079_05860 [Vicingaceae bacterium]